VVQPTDNLTHSPAAVLFVAEGAKAKSSKLSEEQLGEVCV
jgi:hypothetical protein